MSVEGERDVADSYELAQTAPKIRALVNGGKAHEVASLYQLSELVCAEDATLPDASLNSHSEASRATPLQQALEKHLDSPVEKADAEVVPPAAVLGPDALPVTATVASTTDVAGSGDFREILITDLSPGKGQRVDEKDVADLVESFDHTPQLQPIVVRPIPQGFEIIAGHRRAEALRRMGVSHVWALVVDVDDRSAEIYSLEENLKRRPLANENAAKARLVTLLREGRPSARGGDRRSEAYISKRQVGQKVESAVAKVAKETGSSERGVRRALNVEERGSAAVKEALSSGKININEAEKLAGLPPEKQRAQLEAVKQEKARRRGTPKRAPTAPATADLDHTMQLVVLAQEAQRLRDAILGGTPVPQHEAAKMVAIIDEVAESLRALRAYLTAGPPAEARPNTGGECAQADTALATVGGPTDRGSDVQHFVIRAAPRPPSGPPVTFVLREAPRLPSGNPVTLDVEGINKTFAPKAPTPKGDRK